MVELAIRVRLNDVVHPLKGSVTLVWKIYLSVHLSVCDTRFTFYISCLSTK